jgi:hypothetical protein
MKVTLSFQVNKVDGRSVPPDEVAEALRDALAEYEFEAGETDTVYRIDYAVWEGL